MGTVYRSTRYFLFPSVDSTTVLYRICTLYPTLRTQTPNLTTSHSCVCYYTGFYIHTYYLKAKKNRSGDTPSTHSTSQLAVIPRRENVSTSLPIPRSTSVGMFGPRWGNPWILIVRPCAMIHVSALNHAILLVHFHEDNSILATSILPRFVSWPGKQA